MLPRCEEAHRRGRVTRRHPGSLRLPMAVWREERPDVEVVDPALQ
jgi:hypothetical protein